MDIEQFEITGKDYCISSIHPWTLRRLKADIKELTDACVTLADQSEDVQICVYPEKRSKR